MNDLHKQLVAHLDVAAAMIEDAFLPANTRAEVDKKMAMALDSIRRARGLVEHRLVS